MLVLGHLGNTIEAMTTTRLLGADGVELDVRRGAAGAMVVHHGPDIEGLGSITGLAAGDLPSWLPTLEAALDACAGSVVNIEIKNFSIEPDYDATETLAAAVASLVTRRAMEDQVIVSSFSMATIDAVRAAAPTIPTAFLTLPDWDQRRAITTAAEHGHRALHPHERSVDADLVRLSHTRGLAIHPWAVDDEVRVRAIAALGVDAIITDAPAEALEALGRRDRP